MKETQRITEAARAIRQRGEPVEVYWTDDDTGPWDQDRHGAWGGNLVDLSELRRWVTNGKADGRTVTVYCRGDYREVVV